MRAALTTVFGLCGLMAAASCDAPPRDPTKVWSDDFEAACANEETCWSVVTPGTGSASLGAVLHPGERGLRLVGDGLVLRAPARVSQRLSLRAASLLASVAARCDLDSSLYLSVTLAQTVDGAVADELTLSTYLPADTTWRIRTDARLVGTIPESLANGARVVGVTLEKRGAGRCEVADVVLRRVAD